MSAITKHVNHGKKKDGTHDQKKVLAAAEHAVAAMKAGKLKVHPIAQFRHRGQMIKVFATNE